MTWRWIFFSHPFVELLVNSFQSLDSFEATEISIQYWKVK